jgi:hypothetical protein
MRVARTWTSSNATLLYMDHGRATVPPHREERCGPKGTLDNRRNRV